MISQIPNITRRARVALWIALVLSIIDLGLACGNVGTSSLFIGLGTACLVIIHLATHLGVINNCEKHARRATADISHNGITPTDAARLPPTSTLGSILATIILITLYLGAFCVSIWGLVTLELYNLSPVVVCLDATFEMLCAIALIWLLYVGIQERRQYLEILRETRLRDLQDGGGSF